MRWGALVAAVFAVLAVVVVRVADGGGSDSGAAPAASGSAEYGTVDGSDAGLPPDEAEDLAAIFDPALAEVGMRLTRGGLADSPGAAADPSLRDRHLALYVEPLAAEHSPADYLDTLVSSARVFLPSVFDAWPELVSMDVCQEPPPGVDDRAVPPPSTVLEMTRTEAAEIDWTSVDVADLVEARDDGLIRLFLDETIEDDPAFRQAAEGA